MIGVIGMIELKGVIDMDMIEEIEEELIGMRIIEEIDMIEKGIEEIETEIEIEEIEEIDTTEKGIEETETEKD